MSQYTGRRSDRFEVDSLYPPIPRRRRPFDWGWALMALLTLFVAALFVGAAHVRFLGGLS
jgi:hypothetical protein